MGEILNDFGLEFNGSIVLGRGLEKLAVITEDLQSLQEMNLKM